MDLGEAAEVHLVELMFPGWDVTVDGNQADALQSSGISRRVAVTAGQHVIRWRYRPQSFQLGSVISLLSIAVVAICCVRRRDHNSC